MSMIMIRSKILIFGMFILVFHYLLTLGKSQITSSPIVLPPPVSNLIFGDQRLALVYPVIQNFKSLITLDPLNITASWIGSDVCNYKGFYCEDPPDNKSAIALASIDFNGFQLTAPTLDGFLDQLPDLAIFHANSNNFGGTISPNIAKLPYLYELDISNNRFTGPFPSAVLGMIDLSFLDIRFNSFSGTVPPEIFDKDLDVLFINNNNFMTRLPDRITSITTTHHIVYLTLSNNEFFGPIPRNIAKVFANVTEILIQNNLLTGCLPYELGLLKEVVVFDAGNNRLTGPLPWSLGCLQKLEVMNFAGNLLYGAVPEVLCGVGSLGNLTLSDNYFSRVGPVCWGLIKSGVLDVKKNCIPGLPFQRSVAECALFFAQPRHYCPYMPNYGPRFFPCLFHFKSSYELAPAPH